ncbi:MAG: nicotinate-nucleotide adenylyltransferase [Lachnospiraceae bacterium]|nr:nicotinate-nucleotide adenylyltransferase [Lachnospiraceae bacterium]
MERIGIMGGTFDPIHSGHLAMAEAALEQVELDKVLFMPSKTPPHKRHSDVTGERERAEMVQCAISYNPRFEFSDFELKRYGLTYTADTLALLQQQKPDCVWYFIMGGDSFFHVEKWYHPEEILRLSTILAVSRDGLSQEEMERQKAFLEEKYQAKIQLLSMPQMDISSTEIRSKIALGDEVCDMVPESVMTYIDEHGLYR